MKTGDRPIIIVKKKRGNHGGHHGGAWKVAYADFVTAMMAFFLVMWIIGLDSETRESVAAYFNDPVGFVKTHGGGRSPMSTLREGSAGRPSVMPGSRGIAHASGADRLQLTKAQLEANVEQEASIRDLRRFMEVEVTDDGMRVELLEGREGTLFFDTGSARVRPKTELLLRVIGRELAKLPNHIVIEGHTDSRPYAGRMHHYTNWELSADRANAARRVLGSVLRRGQIMEVRGLADTDLRVPTDPLHFSNRRVSILVTRMRSPGDDDAHERDAPEAARPQASAPRQKRDDPRRAPDDGESASARPPAIDITREPLRRQTPPAAGTAQRHKGE
ncbi:MAG TPA: flagellar motor protein MotB [Chthonomonadales bacterium]|nr:flagellar motor protein MotB [Chthonomonadales bacterium]